MISRSIVLIGMPGSGKSTIGRLLSERVNLPFIDTDSLLVEQMGMSLQKFIEKNGAEAFKELEERTLKSYSTDEVSVIATGGSAVLYPDAMAHLKEIGTIVFIDIGLPQLESRIWNFDSRGIVAAGGNKKEALFEIYKERTPLYYKYSDVVIDASKKGKETTLKMILKAVDK